MSRDSPLVAKVGFDLLEPALARDVEEALTSAIAANVVFSRGGSPLEVFRSYVGEAIRDIQNHPRGKLFQRFLRKGSYWDSGPIPPEKAEECLPDAEVGEAIAFIYSLMVNTFQGVLAEILALPACLEIVRGLTDRGELPLQAGIYAGESVRVQAASGHGRAKGADLHILEEVATQSGRGVKVWGVIEVKSYRRSWRRLVSQLSDHLRAAGRGLEVQGATHTADCIELAAIPARIAVVPAVWHLPRAFRFVEEKGQTLLRVDPGGPPTEGPAISRQIADGAWHVTLRWSKEALAASAYEFTFAYMAQVGEVIYAEGVPPGWGSMTPEEAGRNAAKMMLYYAILRAETRLAEQRAIALYNAYGFGYALGTSFRNRKGSRELLWPEDLRELLDRGETKHGCRLRS